MNVFACCHIIYEYENKGDERDRGMWPTSEVREMRTNFGKKNGVVDHLEDLGVDGGYNAKIYTLKDWTQVP